MMPSIRSDVAIGRRMKGREMFIRPVLSRWSWRLGASARSLARVRGRCLRIDLAALVEAVLAVDDDLLAGGEALADGGDAVLDFRDLDVADLDGHVRLDDEEIFAIGAALQRTRGDGDGILVDADDEPRVDELARPQRLVGVVERALEADRAGRRVDLVVDEGELA